MIGRLSPSVAAALAVAGSNAFVKNAADKYLAEQSARLAKPQQSTLSKPVQPWGNDGPRKASTYRAARKARARKAAKGIANAIAEQQAT